MSTLRKAQSFPGKGGTFTSRLNKRSRSRWKLRLLLISSQRESSRKSSKASKNWIPGISWDGLNTVHFVTITASEVGAVCGSPGRRQPEAVYRERSWPLTHVSLHMAEFNVSSHCNKVIMWLKHSLLHSLWWGLWLTNYRTWGWVWGLPKLASVRREGGLKTQNPAVSVQSVCTLNRLFSNFTRWFTPCSIYFHYSFSFHCLTNLLH